MYEAVFEQWNTAVTIVRAAFDSMREPGENDCFNMDCWKLKKKFFGVMRLKLLQNKKRRSRALYNSMDNAAIIRRNAQFIKTYTDGFIADAITAAAQRLVVRQETDNFRE